MVWILESDKLEIMVQREDGVFTVQYSSSFFSLPFITPNDVDLEDGNN